NKSAKSKGRPERRPPCFRCWRGSWRLPWATARRRQPRITPFQEGCFPKGRSAETTQRKTKSLDIGSPPFDWLNTRLMMGSRHPIGKAGRSDESQGRIQPDLTRPVDRAVDAEIVRIVANQRAQYVGVVTDPFLRDDGEAAATARFRHRQFHLADGDAPAEPRRFGKRALDLRHVDEDTRAEPPRIGIAGRMQRLQPRQRGGGEEMHRRLLVARRREGAVIVRRPLAGKRPDRGVEAEKRTDRLIALPAGGRDPRTAGHSDFQPAVAAQPGPDARHQMPFRDGVGPCDLAARRIDQPVQPVAVASPSRHGKGRHGLAGKRTHRIAPQPRNLPESVHLSSRRALHALLFWRLAIRSSTTEGSASVEVSPSAPKSSSAILRKIRRMILAERVLGKPGANWILSGVAMAPISRRTCAISS